MPSWPYAAGKAQFELYNAGWKVGKVGGPFEFTITKVWQELSQYNGSVQGGQMLTIRGHGFDVQAVEEYRCKFTGSDRVGGIQSRQSGAEVQSAGALQCAIPNWAFAEQVVRVEVLENGVPVKFSGTANKDKFQYISTWVRVRTLPMLGAMYGGWRNVDEDNMPYRFFSQQGGTMITISGAGFNETVQHTCLFSCRAVAGVPCNLAPITSQANVIDDEKFLTCRSPEWPYPFETSHWEIDFSMTMTDGAYTYTMHYLGDYFRVFLTKASMNLTQGLDASGSLMGGSKKTPRLMAL